MKRVQLANKLIETFLRECAQRAEELGIDAVTVAACAEITDDGEYAGNGFAYFARDASGPAQMLGTCQQMIVQNATKAIEALAQAAAKQAAEEAAQAPADVVPTPEAAPEAQ